MNNDPEKLLSQLKPQRTSAELRAQVLGAVAEGLRESRAWRRQRRLGLATLGLVILCIGLNFWVNRTVCARIAALFPPPPPPREAVEMANFIANYTNPQARQLIYQQMMTYRPTGDYFPEKYLSMLQKSTTEYENILRDPRHEKMEKDSPLDGNHSGDANRHPADRRCLLCLDYRYTA
jgi:hypothetical protein